MTALHPLCECGHTYAAHESLLGDRQSICEYALAHDGHGCGCAEYDPAERSTPVEMVAEVRNRLEMARVYAEFMQPLFEPPVSGYALDQAMPLARDLNAAIVARWSEAGLRYIKTLAWRLCRRTCP